MLVDVVHDAPNSYGSNSKDHLSHITITNIVIKMFKLLQELPKCDTEAQSE